MSENYKPGTVAIATVRGSGDVRIVRVEYPTTPPWMTLGEHPTGAIWHSDVHVTDVRPLVVLDPEDAEQVERLTGALAIHGANPNDRNYWRETQAALRSLVGPPKPAEPTGLGAVVEDADGKRWTHPNLHPRGEWFSECGNFERTYAEVSAVRVLSEGVTA